MTMGGELSQESCEEAWEEPDMIREVWRLDWVSSLFCAWLVSAELGGGELESCEVEVDLITDTGWEEARGKLGPAEVTEAALVVAGVEAGAGEAALTSLLEAAAAGEDGAEASSLVRSAAARVSQPSSCPALPAPDTSQHAACARDITRPLGEKKYNYKHDKSTEAPAVPTWSPPCPPWSRPGGCGGDTARS